MSKVLIWNNFPLKNIGGQAGYCYNIHKYLEDHPTDSIVFLTDIIAKETGEKCEYNYRPIHKPIVERPSSIRALFQSVPTWLKLWYSMTTSLRYVKGKVRDVKTIVDDFHYDFHRDIDIIPDSIDLEEYDFIHFHWVQTLMQFKAAYPEYRGKLILTPHCPCSWTDERITYHRPIAKYFRWLGIRSECEGYKSADYIMFPCKEAMESYEKVPEIKKVLDASTNKLFFVPTGILDIESKGLRRYSLIEYGIPENAFVVAFFGRHIEIKGYDIIKQVMAPMLEKYSHLYVVCAGKGNIEPLQHERWKELGFVQNVSELLPECDLYFLPNRDTYYDIGVLEVLRAGIHLLMSNTGGNRYFANLPEGKISALSIFDITDIDSVNNIIEQVIDNKKKDADAYRKEGLQNRMLFNKYCTVSTYVEKYLLAISNL